MAQQRMQSFAEFWPYYLGEHRVPLCRRMHFIGTAGWFVLGAWGFYATPEHMALFLGIKVFGMIVGATFFEKRMNPLWLMALIIGSGFYLVPLVIGPALLWAYGWAWVGHFKIEHNRPATFTYPVWSLAGDYRMWWKMARGQLWAGDSIEAAPVGAAPESVNPGPDLSAP